MIQELKKQMQKHKAVRIAMSSGRDSSCVAHLACKTALELKSERKRVPTLIFTTSDTRNESPIIHNLVAADHAKLRAFGEKHGLDILTKIVFPNLSSSFYGRTLGTGVIPAYGNMNRSCTNGWKIAPQKEFIRSYIKTNELDKTDVLTLVGSREAESVDRQKRMIRQGIDAGKVSVDDGYPVLAPIFNWSNDDVFTFLSEINNELEPQTYSDMTDVLRTYKDANGICPIIEDNLSKNKKPCSARFGCVFCVASSVAGGTPDSINGDKSLETLIQHEENGVKPYAYLEPLAAIQRFLASIQYDYDRRSWIGRAQAQGKRTIDSDMEWFMKVEPGIFSGDTLIEMLEYILSAQADEADYASKHGTEPRFEMISIDEVVFIDARQSMYGLTKPHAAMDAYHRIINLGERFYPPHYTETFRPRSPKPKTKYLKLEHLAELELAAFESDMLSEDAELEIEVINNDEFYSVGKGVAEWVQREGAAMLSDWFQKNGDTESRLSAYHFWINSGVRVSKRAIKKADERLLMTEAVELQGLYKKSHKELYISALNLHEVKKKQKKTSVGEISLELEQIPVKVA